MRVASANIALRDQIASHRIELLRFLQNHVEDAKLADIVSGAEQATALFRSEAHQRCDGVDQDGDAAAKR